MLRILKAGFYIFHKRFNCLSCKEYRFLSDDCIVTPDNYSQGLTKMTQRGQLPKTSPPNKYLTLNCGMLHGTARTGS